MLMRDLNAGFGYEGQDSYFFQSGNIRTTSFSYVDYVSMWEKQLYSPIRVMEANSNRKKVWWWFKEGVYCENEGIEPQELESRVLRNDFKIGRVNVSGYSQYHSQNVGSELLNEDKLKNDIFMRRDLSHLIERLEALEERLGIEFNGLYAYSDEDGDIHVHGELRSVGKPELDLDIKVVVSCYDSKGRVIETTESLILRDNFFGLQVFSAILSLSENSPTLHVSRIRIHPRKF